MPTEYEIFECKDFRDVDFAIHDMVVRGAPAIGATAAYGVVLAAKEFLDLDKGEAEAIILSTEKEADLIILDESLGRFHAKHIGLKVTGTIGVLLKAKQLGYITELKPLLFELRTKNVWLSDSFIENAMKLANEK